MHDFYKTLLFNVQSLETLGKLEKVNGTARSVLEKLKGIKADLVHSYTGWQDWDFLHHIVALKTWKDINLLVDSETLRKPPLPKSFRKTKFYHTKAVNGVNEHAFTAKKQTTYPKIALM